MSILHTPMRLPKALIAAALAVATRAGEIVERGWCQLKYSRDKNGRETILSGDDASCFCALGAILRAQWELKREGNADYLGWDPETDRHVSAGDAVIRALEWVLHLGDNSDNSIPTWNDNLARVQTDVVSAFKSVARRLREAEASD